MVFVFCNYQDLLIFSPVFILLCRNQLDSGFNCDNRITLL